MGRSYKDRVVWQKAMDLVASKYRATAGFPKDDLFGLTSQARLAAVSIPSNIAEGQGRLSERIQTLPWASERVADGIGDSSSGRRETRIPAQSRSGSVIAVLGRSWAHSQSTPSFGFKAVRLLD